MPSAVALLLIYLLLLPFMARAGTRDGGGEPYANQFLNIARLIQEAQGAGQIDLGVSNDSLNIAISKIASSLNYSGRKKIIPLLVFPEGETVICFNAPKLGCTRGGHVTVARRGWERATDRERISFVTMELVLMAGGDNRYDVAEIVSKILAFKSSVSPTTDFLGQNPKQLSIEALFDDCTLFLINDALKFDNENSFLQFDMMRKDGYENRYSVSYTHRTSPTVQETVPHSPIQQVLFVSSIYNGEDSARSGSTGLLSTIERGQRLTVHRVSKVFEADENGQCSNIHPPSESSLSVDTDSSRIATRNIFDPCTRAALNFGLERLGQDKGLISLKDSEGNQIPGKMTLISAFRAVPSDRATWDSETFVLNFIVTKKAFSMAYSFKLEGTKIGSQCRVSDIKAH